MKPIYVASWVCAALLFGCEIANAQNAAHAPAVPTAPGVTSHPQPPPNADPNQPADKVPDPETPTAGHDDVTGKDLISPDSTQVEKATTKHPDFMTLDPNNRGYLTPDDVKHNQWLSKNFARCDANHDGHLSQQEYANCK